MLELKLYNEDTIEVLDGSTLFDILVEPSKYEEAWEKLTAENLKVVYLSTSSYENSLIDKNEHLIVDKECSQIQDGQIISHFYLRKREKIEILEEQIKMLSEELTFYKNNQEAK